MSPVPPEGTHTPTQTASTSVDRKKLIHDSDALDEALIETFPASDPVAVSVTRIEVGKGDKKLPIKSGSRSDGS